MSRTDLGIGPSSERQCAGPQVRLGIRMEGASRACSEEEGPTTRLFRCRVRDIYGWKRRVGSKVPIGAFRWEIYYIYHDIIYHIMYNIIKNNNNII